MRLPNENDTVALEMLIDSIGLYEVLSIVEAICVAKADHIRASYGDLELSRSWFKAGGEVCAASSHPAVNTIS